MAKEGADTDQGPHVAGPTRCGGVVSDVASLRHNRIGFGSAPSDWRVADCEPGAEVQVDFGRLGMLTDAGDGRRRVVHGLIFTAVYSRHMFVWPDLSPDTARCDRGVRGRVGVFGGYVGVNSAIRAETA